MIDTRFAPYGIFLLRVALGVMFVAHALLKYLVFTMPGFEGFLVKVGFRRLSLGRLSSPS